MKKDVIVGDQILWGSDKLTDIEYSPKGGT